MTKQQNTPRKKQQKTSKISQAISLLQLKHYGCLTKIFCCKCFYCCQDFDFSLLTSKNRKGVFQQMVKKYLKNMHNSHQSKTNIVMDPFFILVALLLGQQSQIYNQLLQQVTNQNQGTIFSKQDLQFYIPQLCTYLVFHQQMSNAEVTTLLERACKIDLHFSLRYYFFMKSLEIIDSTYEVKKLPIVEKYNVGFRNKINLCHKIKFLTKEKKYKYKDLESKKVDAESDQDNKENQYDKTEDMIRNSTKSGDTTLQFNSKNSLQKAKSPTKAQNNKTRRKYSISSSQSDIDQQFIEQNQKNLKICKLYNQKAHQQKSQESYQYQQKPSFLYIDEIYESFIHKQKQNYPKGLFESTADFFFDLVAISDLLLKIQDPQNRAQNLQKYLSQVNTRLPAAVYIPLTKSSYQGMNILNIIKTQSRIFKTKQRVPYKICFQTFYNPNFNELSHRQKKIRSTMNSSKNLRRSMLFEQDIFLDVDGESFNDNKQRTSLEILEQKVNVNRPASTFQKQSRVSNESTSGITQTNNKNINIDFKSIKKNIWSKLFQLKKLINEKQGPTNHQPEQKPSKKQPNISQTTSQKPQQQLSQKPQQQPNNIQYISNFSQAKYSSSANKKQQQQRRSNTFIEQNLISTNRNKDSHYQTEEESECQENQRYLFGQSESQRFEGIRKRSPYSQLPGYKIISLIIKSNDDLRQEAFAMQLLQQFERIFKMEKLKILLCAYEVMPLSHNSGMIEFLSDAITIDQLIKKQGNLRFVRKDKTKLKNFIRSLVGYSLVSYILQVKDRHNQNIMIKRNGTLIHIDYGFFLSSMPGKGVQLEKNVPFKLTYEYIDALGGLKSKQFNQFRKLFYQGFNALRKHQHRIIILTKLMYSSYGTTMKCFQKGDQSIQKLVSRFNPKNVRTDGQLSLFSQNLINSSIENWRAKWYDRWQYFAQGILY